VFTISPRRAFQSRCNTNESPKRQTLYFYFPKCENLSLIFYAVDRGQKPSRAKTPSPQRKFFSSTDLARFAPLRETQFFRSLFIQNFKYLWLVF
jgi:hypothetical protein